MRIRTAPATGHVDLRSCPAGVSAGPRGKQDSEIAATDGAISVEIGVDLKAGGTGGVSDAHLVAPFGIPVLDGLGAIGENYHSEREYIFAGSLAQRVKLISAFLKNW